MTATATERECQATVVEAARIGGWLVHHARPSQTGRGWRTAIQGDTGFPDLVLARVGEPWRVIVVELKRRPNMVTTEQQRWLGALQGAGIDARVVWVPDQLDDLVGELVRGR